MRKWGIVISVFYAVIVVGFAGARRVAPGDGGIRRSFF
jgi:hypothetical protein